MAKAHRRKDGVYELKFQIDGKRYYVYSKDKQKLKIKYNALKKSVRAGTAKKESKKTITLNEYYKKWFDSYKKTHVKEDTAKNIKIYFEKHILPKIGKLQLEKITSDIVQSFLNEFPKTRTKELVTTYLKSCMTKAKATKLIKDDVFANVVVEKKLNNIRESLIFAEQLKLINYLKRNDERYYYFAMLFLLTGIRRGEIDKLEFYDNYIKVNGTKTETSKNRIVPMTDLFKKNILPFLQKENLKEIKPNYLSQKFTEIFKKLNINKTLHSLRHAFATNLFYLKVQPKFVQGWLGHSTISMTLDIYTNINPMEDIEGLVNYWKNWYFEP